MLPISTLLLLAACNHDALDSVDDSAPAICSLDTPSTTGRVTDASQSDCYDAKGDAIDCPGEGERFYGQDAQYATLTPAWTSLCDGSVIQDERTGLQWEAAHHADRVDYTTAEAWCEGLELGGATDWRVPSIRELFGISTWNGDQNVEGAYYLDGETFALDYPDLDTGDLTGTHSNQMMGQTWSATPRPDTEKLPSVVHYFFNFLDGHIKSQSVENPDATLFYRCVRGEEQHSGFADQGNGTVLDESTGLLWQQDNARSAGDSLQMDWETALATCEALELGGRSDWRLPDVKELESLVDYDPPDWSTTKLVLDTAVFSFALPDGKDLETPPTDSPPDGSSIAPFVWSSTTHGDAKSFAAYVCFGPCWAVQDQGMDSDVHGPGAQRSDPKDDRAGQLWDQVDSVGDQLDVVQVQNFVRCVTDG